MSADISSDTSRSTYRPTLDRYVDQHIGRHSADMSTDTSVDCRSICRPIIYRSRGANETSCIYFLPKIHKPNNPGRPIVSACSRPTELISSYLDKIMTPIVRSLPSYVKDSQHALQIFRDFNFLGEDKLIFTMDITSLYTVIPNGEGLFTHS